MRVLKLIRMMKLLRAIKFLNKLDELKQREVRCFPSRTRAPTRLPAHATRPRTLRWEAEGVSL